jgi:hypothetical protein
MSIHTWDEHLAREARHQARIEAAFDEVDACEQSGDGRQGLWSLRRAAQLSGGLPPAYLVLRARWARELG